MRTLLWLIFKLCLFSFKTTQPTSKGYDFFGTEQLYISSL